MRVLITLLFIVVQLSGLRLNAQADTVNVNNLTGAFMPDCFISNIGQYDRSFSRFNLGEIKFAYEGMAMPVLITGRGVVHLHRKVNRENDYEKIKASGSKKKEEEGSISYTDKIIAMEWVGANINASIEEGVEAPNYFTYGMFTQKAKGYKKVIIKNIYPDVDLIYLTNEYNKTGFEYRLIVKPGGDVSKIKMRYDGDVESISLSKDSGLVIKSSVDDIVVSKPVSFNVSNFDEAVANPLRLGQNIVASSFNLKNNEITFDVTGYDKSKTLVIDPFISSTSNLTGSITNSTIAKDVDFDYEGNIYVSGGGNTNFHKLAKFNSSGVLLWTFNGSLTVPAWNFGGSYGGWVVEKNTGNIYLGQGYNTNSRVVRLNTNGIYDNYISNGNAKFTENWRMIWSCVNGEGQLIIGGGAVPSNLNFTTLSPPSPNSSPTNITGNSGNTQDIADMVIDPVTNDLYTIFASGGTPFINNRMFKHSFPYTAGSIIWQVPSGYNTMKEADNKPYLELTSLLPGFNTSDNSINLFALNSDYLFYWDGKNLKAFDKATGAGIGSPLTTGLREKMQGGIYADECNNVFIGYKDGHIKVLHFDGSVFNDSAVADINIPEYPLAETYDLAFNNANKLLYAAGHGFVASFDISSYCKDKSQFKLSVITDCVNDKAKAIINPGPPSGSTITYNLYQSGALLSSNTTGIFTGLTDSVEYAVRAIINQSCSGAQTDSINFSYPYCEPVLITLVHTTCGNNNGQISLNAIYGTPPYLFSIDGANFQKSDLFSNLAPGSYIVTAKDFNGTVKKIQVMVNASTSLKAQGFLKKATCGLSNGSILINASGGGGGYLYTLDGTNFQASNLFDSLLPQNYVVTIKDSTGCTTQVPLVIDAIKPPSVKTSAVSASCLNNDGVINVLALDGTKPYLYSIDGTTFQSSASFTGLGIGTYHITLKDSNNCSIKSEPIELKLAANTVMVKINQPEPVCQGETLDLNVFSNALKFSWQPATGLNDPARLQPKVSVLTTTKYYLTATTGICSKTDSVTVVIYPLPFADAGKDATVCNGKSIQLNGNGGVEYFWSPPTYLSNIKISNPIMTNPLKTVKYALAVKDGNGCFSAKQDTVIITVLPPAQLFAGNDTVITVNQPLQLDAVDINNTGFTKYLWSPATGLNNQNSKSPSAILDKTITYQVVATTVEGCRGVDDIMIKVYLKPEIFVPNVFTPNKDRHNDVLKAIPVGIKEFDYFKIYNRYGQLVFSTSNYNNGWDGIFNGIAQPTATFVWEAKAIDYKNKVLYRKGTVTLIR